MSISSIMSDNGIDCFVETLADNHKLFPEYSYSIDSGHSVLNGPTTNYKITFKNENIEKSFFFCIPKYSDLEYKVANGIAQIIDPFFREKILHMGCVCAHSYKENEKIHGAYWWGIVSLKSCWGWSMSRELFSDASERVKQDYFNLKEALGNAFSDVLEYIAKTDGSINIRMAIAMFDECSGETIMHLMEDEDLAVRAFAKRNKKLSVISPFF